MAIYRFIFDREGHVHSHGPWQPGEPQPLDNAVGVSMAFFDVKGKDLDRLAAGAPVSWDLSANRPAVGEVPPPPPPPPPPPTPEEEVEWQQLKAKMAYRVHRQRAYPDVGDQLDAIVDALGMLNDGKKIEAGREQMRQIIARIEQVKQVNPKPTEQEIARFNELASGPFKGLPQ